jgi:hypothetical protein
MKDEAEDSDPGGTTVSRYLEGGAQRRRSLSAKSDRAECTDSDDNGDCYSVAKVCLQLP